jgi:hypothetical protein
MADTPTPNTNPPARPLMTMRVSRDSGASYGPVTRVMPDDPLPPLTHLEWPPCRCPIHRDNGGTPLPWTSLTT